METKRTKRHPAIAAVLRERITPKGYRHENGDQVTYTEKLPTLTQLCEEFGEPGRPINHATVGKALQTLVSEGLLEVEDRRGYFVRRDPVLRYNLTRTSDYGHQISVPVDSWETDVQSAGYSTRQAIEVETLSSGHKVADTTVGELLELPPNTLVLARRRTRYIGRSLTHPATEPESLHTTYYRLEAAEGTALTDPASTNTTRILAERGYAPYHRRIEIAARPPTREETEKLRLHKATAVQERIVVTRTRQGLPIYVQHTITAGNDTRVIIEITTPEDA